MPDLERLRWRCRRGARELDLLLEHYLDMAYAEADDAEKDLFADLLNWEDDALLDTLIGEKKPEKPGFDGLIEKIRGNSAADNA